MKVALIHTYFEIERLEQVEQQMLELGPPKIRAIWLEDRGMWAALEGCHRTRAAARLGVEPVMVPVEYRPGMSWEEIGMEGEPIATLSDWSVDDVVANAGKEIVIGFGEDGPPPRSEVRRPGPGEIMKYRVIQEIGFDFGENGVVHGYVGRIIWSSDAPYDLTPWVAMGHLVIVEDAPAKVTKEVREAPRRKVGR